MNLTKEQAEALAAAAERLSKARRGMGKMKGNYNEGWTDGSTHATNALLTWSQRKKL